ncbi:hypothetical protein C1Y40_04999 [Mycobacterium talmoniae]|uniref:AbiEi antitoxin C-terminal domain-containing protein n=1 Tax=Mycobacterium talmoniae TaxID=1858794 RepID=A0A2S8BDT4_9MYCO|nr:hypothetical protein C1Y40_04999 [Mycobacterium talmoniae]
MVRGMRQPFIGSEELACGALNRHQLRTRYRAVFPNVYLPQQVRPSLEQRALAAWLWSGREAVIAGMAAAALHGAKWVDDDLPVELIYPNPRPPPGVVTRRELLLEGETQVLAERTITTPERTAFDLGRRGPIRAAVARLDALAQATELNFADVALIGHRHPHTRGLRQLERVLDLVDAGAQSPKETYLRLLLVEAGLPRPQTQIRVTTEDAVYYLDMGWEEYLVAVEYDATNTGPTAGSSSKTFGDWRPWNEWGGSSSGWSPRTAPLTLCDGCGERWQPAD